MNLSWGTLSFYLTHSMRSPSLEHSPTWFTPFQLTCPLVTVCILLLDLVIALAKSSLVLVFSVQDTSIWACSLSQQPSLRAFSWCSFMMSFMCWSYLLFSQIIKPFLDRLWLRWQGPTHTYEDELLAVSGRCMVRFHPNFGCWHWDLDQEWLAWGRHPQWKQGCGWWGLSTGTEQGLAFFVLWRTIHVTDCVVTEVLKQVY